MSHPSYTWTLIPDPAGPGAALDSATSSIATGVDWALDLDSGDLIFPLRYTTGLEAVAQGIRIALLNFRDEWFLNLDDGIPYLVGDSVTPAQAILGQRYDEAKSTAAFRGAVQAVPHVDAIPEFSIDFAGATRTMTISFRVESQFGTVVVDSLEV